MMLNYNEEIFKKVKEKVILQALDVIDLSETFSSFLLNNNGFQCIFIKIRSQDVKTFGKYLDCIKYDNSSLNTLQACLIVMMVVSKDNFSIVTAYHFHFM